MTRVLVCSGRDYADQAAVFAELNALRDLCGPLVVIQSGAAGAARHARAWCLAQDSVCLINEPADWRQFGRAAGPLRNGVMIAEHRPDLVIAFPGGSDTADMVRKAEAAGIPVRRVSSDSSPPPLSPSPAVEAGR